jgi:hypothetical protein
VVCVPEGEGVVAYLVSWTGGFGRGGALGRSRVERRCAGPGRWEAMLSLYNVLEKEVADALLNRIPWSEGANACGGTPRNKNLQASCEVGAPTRGWDMFFPYS